MNLTTIELPDMVLEATNGKINLRDHLGEIVILYFYPKDATPGCTTEGQNFRDLYPEFQQHGAVIYGVSRDSLKSHERFREKQGFPFHLISDTDEQLCQHFDVIKEKNMYGRKVLGIERSTFLFDRNGKLVREWRKVRVKGHVEEVLNTIQTLTNTPTEG